MMYDYIRFVRLDDFGINNPILDKSWGFRARYIIAYRVVETRSVYNVTVDQIGDGISEVSLHNTTKGKSHCQGWIC